jgi:hypothetical protein
MASPGGVDLNELARLGAGRAAGYRQTSKRSKPNPDKIRVGLRDQMFLLSILRIKFEL